MTAELKLFEITGSPNNVKVRIALGYKGLDYAREPFEFEGFPGDRSDLVQQPESSGTGTADLGRCQRHGFSSVAE